jgi:hypothetical protein
VNFASRAAAHLRSRYERGHAHQTHDVDPQPDADGSTAWLEELSDELMAEYRAKLKRRPLVKHPDRSNVWTRGGDAA